MQNIFSYENPFNRFMNRLGDLFILGIFVFVFSLPLITAGASLTAAYDVCMKMHRNEEGPVVSEFLRSFRKNLKESLGGWILLLCILALLVFNLFCFRVKNTGIFSFGFGCMLSMLAMFTTFLSWYLSYRARFKDTIKGSFRCAYGFMMINLLLSIGILFAEIVVLLLFNISMPFLFLVIVGGIGVIIYPKAVYFDNCYMKYISSREKETVYTSEEPKDYNLSRLHDPAEECLTGKELIRYRLSKMNTREKLSYLFHYYGKAVGVVMISLMFVLVIMHDVLKQKQNTEPHVMAVNAFLGNEKAEVKPEICRIQYEEHTGGAVDYSDYEKFFIMISVGQIDCALVPESFLSYCNDVDAIFKNVNDILSEDQLKSNNERLLVDENSDGEVFACGLRVTDLPYIKEMELEFIEDNAGEEMILVYPINADNKGFCREYTEKILENK